MNQLGLSSRFGSLFEGGSEVLTLQQFFNRNSSLFYIKYKSPLLVEYFHCFPEGSVLAHKKFKRRSRSFKSLYELLRKNGFRHEDWVFLLPKAGNGEFLYQELPKETLGTFPLCRVVDVQVAARSLSPFCRIIESVLGEDVSPFDVTICEFIALERVKILCKNPNLRSTLRNIQNTLRSYGFTQRDGPFMGIRFKEKKK